MHQLVVVLLLAIGPAIGRFTQKLQREGEPLLKGLGTSEPCNGRSSVLHLLWPAYALIPHACWGLSAWLRESFLMMLKLWIRVLQQVAGRASREHSTGASSQASHQGVYPCSASLRERAKVGH